MITDHGSPTALVLPLANVDLETIALSTNPEFMALIEQSRARDAEGGGIPADEMRRRFLSDAEQ